MALYKRGKIWFIDYYYPPGRGGKRIREKVGPSKEEAQIVLSERLKDIRQGRNPELRRLPLTLFSDHAREVVAKHYANKRCHAWAKLEIEANLIPYFGAMFLTAITPKHVSGYITHRTAAGAKHGTINRERAVLSKIMSSAVQWERIHDNPIIRVERLEEVRGRVRFLEHDEADKLIACAAPHLKPIIVTALETGGRKSEVLGLTWKDVERGVVYFGRTKSGKGREVPITPVLASTFKELSKVRRIDGRVFTFRGRPIKSVRTAFDKAREDAGLGDDVVFHTTRHSFASWYVMRGGDLYRLKELLGHRDIKTTMIYAHLSPEHVQGAVTLMGRQPQIGGHLVDTNPHLEDLVGSGSGL